MSESSDEETHGSKQRTMSPPVVARRVTRASTQDMSPTVSRKTTAGTSTRRKDRNRTKKKVTTKPDSSVVGNTQGPQDKFTGDGDHHDEVSGRNSFLRFVLDNYQKRRLTRAGGDSNKDQTREYVVGVENGHNHRDHGNKKGDDMDSDNDQTKSDDELDDNTDASTTAASVTETDSATVENEDLKSKSKDDLEIDIVDDDKQNTLRESIVAKMDDDVTSNDDKVELLVESTVDQVDDHTDATVENVGDDVKSTDDKADDVLESTVEEVDDDIATTDDKVDNNIDATSDKVDDDTESSDDKVVDRLGSTVDKRNDDIGETDENVDDDIAATDENVDDDIDATDELHKGMNDKVDVDIQRNLPGSTINSSETDMGAEGPRCASGELLNDQREEEQLSSETKRDDEESAKEGNDVPMIEETDVPNEIDESESVEDESRVEEDDHIEQAVSVAEDFVRQENCGIDTTEKEETAQTKSNETGRYNLREKKKAETQPSVTRTVVPDNDNFNQMKSRKRSNSLPALKSSRARRVSTTSIGNESASSRNLADDQCAIASISSNPISTPLAKKSKDKPENPFFKYFRTIDKWFLSNGGKQNYQFRKCVCIYCEEHFKDGLIDTPPRPILKKSRNCRTHLENCLPYQLYLRKSGTKSVTESTEVGLKKDEIKKRRERLAKEAAEAKMREDDGDTTEANGMLVACSDPDSVQETFDDIINNGRYNNSTFGADIGTSDTTTQPSNVDEDNSKPEPIISTNEDHSNNGEKNEDEITNRIKRRMLEESNNLLTKRAKTLAHSFYEHFRFFDESRIVIRNGVPTVHKRGYCIHCEEQYNVGLTDRKPDFITKRARNCRSHLDSCKHYKAFLSSTGQQSVTTQTTVGLEKNRREKFIKDAKQKGEKIIIRYSVGSRRSSRLHGDSDDDSIVADEALSGEMGLKHKLLLSTSDTDQKEELNDDDDDDQESEATQKLRSIFDLIVPLAEVDEDVHATAMLELNNTLTKLRDIVEDKKRKLEEALLKMSVAGTSGKKPSSKKRNKNALV